MAKLSDKTPDCILCGKCLEVCPMVQASGREELSPKAKHYLAQTLRDDPAKLKGADAAQLAALCMACERCADSCPRGLSGAETMARLRNEHPEFEQWLWKNWIRAGWLLWPALMNLAKLAPERMAREGASKLAETVRRLKGLDERSRLEPWLAVESYDRSREAEPVVVFPGCTASNSRTDWTDQAFRVLDGLGMDVSLAPDWTCCGATLGHAGVLDAQAAMQQRNVREWRAAGRPRIVTFCASCLHGLRDYARPGGAVEWNEGEAKTWLGAVTPLAALWGETAFAPLENAPDSVLYHSPCHSRAGKHTDEDHGWLVRTLADRLVGANTARCCGMGGIMQLAAPEFSASVVSECWQELAAPVADSPAQLLTGCSGCVLQLRASAPANVQVGHWLEILA